MKTFETEKHNMPEGATHYYYSCSGYGWVKKEPCATGRDKSFIWDGGKWVRGVVVSYVVKPIPTIPAETPEGKEALCEKTYRYEKVTDSIFDLKEEFERGELFSFDGNEHYVQIETEGDFSYAHIYENLYRRIEVTERELFIELVERVGSELMDNGEWSFACLATSILDSEEFNITKGKG